MKRFLSVIFSTLLALTLAACTTTTMDPTVGKADYQTYIKWLEGVESTMNNKFEEELSQAKSKNIVNIAEETNLLNSRIEKSINDAIESGKALNLRHEDVRKHRDMTVEVLNIYKKQVLPAYFLPTEENIKNAEAVQTKLGQLVMESGILFDKLYDQFGK